MPRKTIKPKEVAEITPEVTVTEKPKAKQTFVVTNSGGGEVRSYTVDIHGEKAEDLAREYAAKIGGSVQ
jgi:hypothetical protein